jgi:hypothetical protein
MDVDLSDIKSSDNVPLTSRDRHFFIELNRFMNDELAKVGDNPSKERFAIFRLIFEKVNFFYLFSRKNSKKKIFLSFLYKDY